MAKKPNETSLVKQGSFDPTQLSDTHRKILYALSQLFEGTHEEIAVFLKIEKRKVCRRLSELDKKGLIYHIGIKKALRSGRAGFCWRLTDVSLPKTTAAEKALKGPGIAYFSRKINDIAKSIPSSNIAKTLF
jgi:DNA-binding Lrp family transcriptional regulator